MTDDIGRPTDASVLGGLGLRQEEIEALLRQGASVHDAQHLIHDLGCPPRLAADILLWAAEVEKSAAERSS